MFKNVLALTRYELFTINTRSLPWSGVYYIVLRFLIVQLTLYAVAVHSGRIIKLQNKFTTIFFRVISLRVTREHNIGVARQLIPVIPEFLRVSEQFQNLPQGHQWFLFEWPRENRNKSRSSAVSKFWKVPAILVCQFWGQKGGSGFGLELTELNPNYGRHSWTYSTPHGANQDA